MCDFRSFVIGHETSQHLKMTILSRTHPECSDFWEGNWVHSDLSATVGGFSGHVRACLRVDEIKRFRDQFAPLYDALDGVAEFTSLEHWISVKITGDGLGHFNARCELRDDPSFPNRLIFDLTFDQTMTPSMLRQLDSILDAFPVTGNRQP